jgi:hypothetical protein
VVTANVASSENLFTDSYWNVSTAPPQVIIRSMQSTRVPNVSANVRITNEGQVPYEYQYEWCVVTDINNGCGNGNDTYFASAAKLIQPGANFDTVLPATVPLTGTYYFKVAVFYGTDSSRSVQQFTATPASNSGNNNPPPVPPSSSGGGGGGGGGGSGLGTAILPQPTNTSSTTAKLSCGSTADLNCDGGVVNSIDFSIMLSFWKTKPPFKNTRVDINHDGKLDLSDFSILLYYWNKSHK